MRPSGTAPVWTRATASPEGIRPATRTHVHCIDALDSAVGKRSRIDLVLEIYPERMQAHDLPVFRSQNSVPLVREGRVLVRCIVGLVPLATRARQETASLRALLFGEGSREAGCSGRGAAASGVGPGFGRAPP